MRSQQAKFLSRSLAWIWNRRVQRNLKFLNAIIDANRSFCHLFFSAIVIFCKGLLQKAFFNKGVKNWKYFPKIVDHRMFILWENIRMNVTYKQKRNFLWKRWLTIAGVSGHDRGHLSQMNLFFSENRKMFFFQLQFSGRIWLSTFQNFWLATVADFSQVCWSNQQCTFFILIQFCK